jgi:hypothetical protein
MHAAVRRLTETSSNLIARFPWGGWIGWLIFCAIALARVTPRRFASTFTYYIEATERLLAHGQVYDPHTLGAFLYLPISLLLYAPFTAINPSLTAGFWLFVFGAAFTWGCYRLTMQLLQEAGDLKPVWLAGIVLLINVPAAWFNFKGVQAQIIMTGAMMLAAVSVMQSKWLWAAAWLFIGFVFKPLALVMALLCAVLCPRMRLPLAVALVLVVVLPFAFFDPHYMAEQYRDLGVKLWLIATSPAMEWPYRADLSTLLRALGIVMPSSVSLAVRLAAALGTLFLAWRVRGTGARRSFGFALVILSACYINLFSPRNEFLSFLVLTPSLSVLGLLMLARDQGDWRGWLLIAAALVLGMWWSLSFDAVTKPAIVVVVVGWLTWLMVQPKRWCALVETASSDGSR